MDILAFDWKGKEIHATDDLEYFDTGCFKELVPADKESVWQWMNETFIKTSVQGIARDIEYWNPECNQILEYIFQDKSWGDFIILQSHKNTNDEREKDIEDQMKRRHITFDNYMFIKKWTRKKE